MRPQLLIAMLLVVPAMLRSADETPKVLPKKVSIGDFSFITGHNRGESEGTVIDEHWSEPAGENMVGMYREIKNGRVELYEFMAIEMTADRPVLRLRHFSPGLIGWEEKTQVYSYPLVSFRPGEAVFERPDKATRITYHTTSADTLESVLERSGHKTEIFRYAHTPE